MISTETFEWSPSDEVVWEDWTERQLYEAFQKVKSSVSWKAPIDAVVPASEQDITTAAIVYYTATKPIFEPLEGTDNVRVTAAGYWFGPAGP